jgi:hypothetical protein
MQSKKSLLSVMPLIVMMIGLLLFYPNAGIGSPTGEPVTFSVTGDYPYEDEISIFERHIYENCLLYNPSDFFVHVGDLFDQNEPSWGEDRYELVATGLKALGVPAFIVIGDNDWTDSSDPAQGFQWWYDRFAHFEENWSAAPAVERQNERQENWAFVMRGVLFIGVNYPGSRAGGDVLNADAEWVKSQFEGKAGQIRAAVVFGHKGPIATLNSFFTQLVASSIMLGKPVIYIQGHDHRWQYDKYGDGTPGSAWLAPNMQRLIVNRGGKEDPVQITVTMDPANPFEFTRNPLKFDFLAQKKFKADKYGDSEGNVRSNENIEFRQGLPSLYQGNLIAVKDIKIEEKNTIYGDATAGNKLEIESGATVIGTPSEHATVLPLRLPHVFFEAGSSEIKLDDDEVRSLAPGSYGNVEAGKRSFLMLSPGEYFLKKLNMKDDATLYADVSDGDIVINVVEEIDFHKRARVDMPSGINGNYYLILKQVKDKDILFDDDSRFWGLIIAPLAKVKLERNSEFQGRIVAKEIEFKENATLHPFQQP